MTVFDATDIDSSQFEINENFSIQELDSENSIISDNSSFNVEDPAEPFDLATEFSISFETKQGLKKFSFSILPAVDDGNETTAIPEIKPGILKRTNVQIKRFVIPGSGPVFQVVGIKETILQCVGLLMGNESSDLEQSPLASDLYKPLASLNAYKSALHFDQEVVQRGVVCTLNIISNNNSSETNPVPAPPLVIRHKCLIQNFRYFINRVDRVWYALELLLLDYTPGGTEYNTEDGITDSNSEQNNLMVFGPGINGTILNSENIITSGPFDTVLDFEGYQEQLSDNAELTRKSEEQDYVGVLIVEGKKDTPVEGQKLVTSSFNTAPSKRQIALLNHALSKKADSENWTSKVVYAPNDSPFTNYIKLLTTSEEVSEITDTQLFDSVGLELQSETIEETIEEPIEEP